MVQQAVINVFFAKKKLSCIEQVQLLYDKKSDAKFYVR